MITKKDWFENKVTFIRRLNINDIKMIKNFETSFTVLIDSREELEELIKAALNMGRIPEEQSLGFGNILLPYSVFFSRLIDTKIIIYVFKDNGPYPDSFGNVLISIRRMNFKDFKRTFKKYFPDYYCDYCGEEKEDCKCNLEEIKKIENEYNIRRT